MDEPGQRREKGMSTAFQRRIRRLARESELIVSDLRSDVAKLLVDVNGTFRNLYVTDYDGIWEFAGYTIVAGDSADDFPHALLAMLLEHNSTAKRGFWSMASLADRIVIVYMHNMPSSLLTAEEFREICGTVVRQAEMLNDAVRRTEEEAVPPVAND